MGGRTSGAGTFTRIDGAPPRAGLVLTALLLTAIVSDFNISAATVALPDIGEAFGAPQLVLNIIGLGAGLGLSMSVLYFGALADRYGRKHLLLIGLALLAVASLASAFAPTPELLTAARVFTGLAAGMAFPTTLSLITALWSPGTKRTSAIAIWASVGGMAAVLGGVVAGALLLWFPWGSVFFLSVPIAVIAFALVWVVVPSHVDESDEPVDHLGGVISAIGIGLLVLGISFALDPDLNSLGVTFLVVAAVLIVLFGVREHFAKSPIFDLHVARRRMFWVPAVTGGIVFGGMIGAIFIGQQFMQNVLGYSALQAGLAVVPAAIGLVICAPIAARVVTSSGTRITMLTGYSLVFVGYVTMLFWREDTTYLLLGIGYLAVGGGAAFVVTAASRALTSSTPVRRVGMASATSDLQADLGGSIFQALLGAVLAVGFASTASEAIAAADGDGSITAEVQRALTASFSSAAQVAAQYPQYESDILAAARQSLLDGALASYLVGGIAIVLGAVLVVVLLPTNARERELLSGYLAEGEAGSADAASGAVSDAAPGAASNSAPGVGAAPRPQSGTPAQPEADGSESA